MWDWLLDEVMPQDEKRYKREGEGKPVGFKSVLAWAGIATGAFFALIVGLAIAGVGGTEEPPSSPTGSAASSPVSTTPMSTPVLPAVVVEPTAVPTEPPVPTAVPTEPPVPTAVPTERPAPTPVDPPDGGRPASGRPTAQVARVIDGDTIELSDGRRVRYIGIDTPETVDPSQPVGCYGKEASDRNKALVEGKTVSLEKDVSETDRFGRLLRYVYLGDVMVNELLVSEGFAQASSFPPDVKYQDRFTAAQQQARAASRGLWGPACAAPAATPPPASGGNCSPAYPGVCIAPPPPDLDCPQISHRRFQVLPPDPHRFDSDSDGIGCETG
jgi:endonuclease YncB( thermonuclease family)